MFTAGKPTKRPGERAPMPIEENVRVRAIRNFAKRVSERQFRLPKTGPRSKRISFFR